MTRYIPRTRASEIWFGTSKTLAPNPATALCLEVSASTGDLLLALCWPLVGDQQSCNDHGESTNNNKLLHLVILEQPKQLERKLQDLIRPLQWQIVIADHETQRFSLIAQMAFQSFSNLRAELQLHELRHIAK